jgi:hypothetical protein
MGLVPEMGAAADAGDDCKRWCKGWMEGRLPKVVVGDG